MRRLSYAKVITARQIAEMLGHDTDENGKPLSKEEMSRWGRRWLHRNGIARQARGGGGGVGYRGTNVYTTVSDLMGLNDKALVAELFRGRASR